MAGKIQKPVGNDAELEATSAGSSCKAAKRNPVAGGAGTRTSRSLTCRSECCQLAAVGRLLQGPMTDEARRLGGRRVSPQPVLLDSCTRDCRASRATAAAFTMARSPLVNSSLSDELLPSRLSISRPSTPT